MIHGERGAIERLPRKLLRTASILGSVLAPTCIVVPSAFGETHSQKPARIAAKKAGEILFASNRTGHFQIYEENLATKKPIQLTQGKHDSMNPQPSPDGKEVVFYSDRQDGINQIYKLELDDPSHVVRLTNDDASDFDPVFMPDGKRVLYKSNKDDGYGDIWIMNSNGSNTQNLTPEMTKTEEWKPEPISSTEVIFTSMARQGDSSSNDMYELNITAPDSVPTRLTNNKVPDWFPSYNGKSRVAFISKTNSTKPDAIYTMTTDGKDKKMVTSPKWTNDSDDPSWSPDGKNIFFVRHADTGYGIWEMNSRGGDLQKIDQGPSGDDLSPVFVPGSQGR